MGNTSSCPISGSWCKSFDGCGQGQLCQDNNHPDTYYTCAADYCNCTDKITCPYNAPGGKSNECHDTKEICCSPHVYCGPESAHPNTCQESECICKGKVKCKDGGCANSHTECCINLHETPAKNFACSSEEDGYHCVMSECYCHDPVQYPCKHKDLLDTCVDSELLCCDVDSKTKNYCGQYNERWQINREIRLLGACVEDPCLCAGANYVYCRAPDLHDLQQCAVNSTACCDAFNNPTKLHYCGLDTKQWGHCAADAAGCEEV